jgi:hypothetical protein
MVFNVRQDAEIAMETLEEVLVEVRDQKTATEGGKKADASLSLEELDEMLDGVADDEEERARAAFRATRIAEMEAAAGKQQFGEVVHITGREYGTLIHPNNQQAAIWGGGQRGVCERDANQGLCHHVTTPCEGMCGR